MSTEAETLNFVREGDELVAEASQAKLKITLEADDVAACALDFHERSTLHLAVQGLYVDGLAEEAVQVTAAVYSALTGRPFAVCSTITTIVPTKDTV